MRQPCPVGGHAVEAFHRADGHRVLVGPRVTHHADALDRQQHREALPQPLIPAGLANLLRDDLVGQPQQIQPLARDLADDAHRKPRTRERLADDKLAVEAQVAADAADFVLEEIAQRFDQREVHPLRQAAHVVMALDDDGRSEYGGRFDDVGIERPLAQEVKPPELLRALLEDIDEGGADDLPLRLRIGDAGQPLEEEVRGVHEIERELHLLREAGADLAGLLVPQQAVVHEDAGEAIADRAMHEERRHRRVDAARESADDFAAPDLLPDPVRRLLDERRNRPVAGASADVEGKVAENFRPMVGVRDLGMKQQRVERPIGRFHGCDRCGGARSRDRKSRRHRRHIVPVARPDAERARQLREQTRARSPIGGHVHQRVAELAVAGATDFATQHIRHQLHAVADAEHRRAELEDLRRALRRPCLRHALRAAGQDDPARILRPQRLERRVERHHLRVHRQLAQTTSNQLRVLRAEIQNENGLMGH